MREYIKEESEQRKLERELVEKTLAGDNDAFTELVGMYYRIFMALALSYMHDLGRAEDIVQEGLFTMHEELGTLREPEKFGSWGYTIIRRKAIRAIKIMKKESKTMVEYSEKEEVKKAQEKSSENMDLRDKKEAIVHGISKLSHRYREIMTLYYLEQLDLQQICIKLRLSRRATDIRLYRARKKLKEILEGIE